MKLGLKDPRPGAIPLRFATYVDWSKMPTVPQEFGHYDLIPPSDWGVLLNDVLGCCAISGPEHQTMLNTKEGLNRAAPFNDSSTIQNYSECADYDPSQTAADGSNPTDQGTDIGLMAQHWLSTGLVDANGQRHKIVAVCDMNPGDLRELWLATYLFQSVGMGFALPDSAEDQTNNGKVWDVVPGATIVGGHYVPNFGCAGGLGVGVTWGLVQPFTPLFYKTYNNQGIVAFSEEMMVRAKSIDGFADAMLLDDMTELRKDLAR